ncbi:hypothetical protein Nepgr_008293 [Nepenthes gracilis]|uniref:CASP-like protein n=1 Tax=Nepenthes gracilis TaxID=150966 RepID=A0AAD3S8H2_NEPGR|nr:hypothetical protein Nepgr_008293 [Nepenthes gracilis]
MDEVPGSLGTSASFALRLGQTLFSTASLFFMCLAIDFYSYTAFCFLVTIMGLVIPWSMTLSLVDVYCVFVRCPSRQPGIMTIIIVGDWVLSFLSLAAASSTAGVAQLLLTPGSAALLCPLKHCNRYPLSAAMAFLSWFLLFASCLFNIWLLPKL